MVMVDITPCQLLANNNNSKSYKVQTLGHMTNISQWPLHVMYMYYFVVWKQP